MRSRGSHGCVVLLVGASLIGVGIIWVLTITSNTTEPVEPPSITAHGQPRLQDVSPPSVTFTDITQESGITFRHVNGGFGQKLLPETMGSGVVVFDYDNDGDQDIFFVNSDYWPKETTAHFKAEYDLQENSSAHALYQNDGHGNFEDVTRSIGLDFRCYGMGAAAGDINNDGFPELLITSLNGVYLFANDGGATFRDITNEAVPACSGWRSSAAFLDYDLDGRLDLFIGGYIQWTPETDLHCSIDGQTKSYCQPMLYEGLHCKLFRNIDGSRFEDVSKASGIEIEATLGKTASKCLGVAVHDYDDDGLPDIAVANDTTPNFLFRNNGDGTFTNVAAEKGVVLLNQRGAARGAMGIDWGYYRDSATLGLAIGNFSNEMNGLLRYDSGHDIFVDCAAAEGVGGPSRLPLKFGLFFFDYDLDGRLDLLTHNGHIEPEIEKFQGAVTYAQPVQLYWNVGPGSRGCFRLVDEQSAGDDLFQPRVGRGCAYGDFDGDGDLDVVLSNNNQNATLLRNDCPPTARAVQFRFRGAKSNRSGLGCRVKLIANGQTQQAELNSGGSYLSQSESVLTFGLGPAEQVDEVTIRWPGKDIHDTILRDLPSGYAYFIDERAGILRKAPFSRAIPSSQNRPKE